MRVVRDDALREGFGRRERRRVSAFGDERIYLEKLSRSPRHIEIQVLGDAHGTSVHLGERECSIQRRHQKIVEEAPSPWIDADRRALRWASRPSRSPRRSATCVGAGTVEFIVDRDRTFYFLEMNTRLQVEHPVTELATGLDLVRERDPDRPRRSCCSPRKRRQRGWAVERASTPEDPARNFLPSIGRLTRHRPPEEEDGCGRQRGV